MLKSLFRKPSVRGPLPRVPDGLRVYAIGDIHGCDDEFAALLARIDADDAARTPRPQLLILLGDLVDRGPASAAVVERALRLARPGRTVRTLAGNHEEMLLGALAGDARALRLFARNGGRETALSYGIAPETYDEADFDMLPALLAAAIPAEHRVFLEGLEDLIEVGDYAFVHAGIRPGVPLAEQRTEDMRWIRERFLAHRRAHDHFIVHGHTIVAEVDEQDNRLGIDTGAYATGRLTAVALEGDRRWFLQS